MTPRANTYPALSEGRARQTGTPKRVADVESLPRPRGGLHRLANSAVRGGLVTACVGCGETWTTLDAQARKAGLR